MIKPNDAAWDAHFQFLSRCEEAAVERRSPLIADAPAVSGHMSRRLIVSMQSMAQRQGSCGTTSVAGYPDTLSELFEGISMPVVASRLPELRAQRIETLRQWLDHFPAQQWLANQRPVREAYVSFQRVRKRSDCAPALLSDLAELRFWKAAGLVARACDGRRFSPYMPQPPDADQRKRAANAAKEIIAIAKATTLLMSAGLTPLARDELLAGLEMIQAHAQIARRKRMDAREKERDFIQVATMLVKYEMRAVSTAVVAALVGLFVTETGEDELRKQIQAQKKQLEVRAKGGEKSA